MYTINQVNIVKSIPDSVVAKSKSSKEIYDIVKLLSTLKGILDDPDDILKIEDAEIKKMTQSSELVEKLNDICGFKFDDSVKMRNLLDTVYDIQKLRISTGNRLVAIYRPQLDDENLLDTMCKEYRSVTDLCIEKSKTVKSVLKTADELQIIRSSLDYELIETYIKLVESENKVAKVIEKTLADYPIYEEFLKDVKGCGTLMSAVLIAYLDPRKARHCSSFWKYAGLDVVTDEKGSHGRRKGDTEDTYYLTSNGEIEQKKGITYQPFLKSKLIGVLAGSFIKSRSPYSQIYYDYKSRLQSENADIKDAVAHARAQRYMIKMFLRDLWVKWRTIENLPVSKPYEQVYLNKSEHHSPNLNTNLDW